MSMLILIYILIMNNVIYYNLSLITADWNNAGKYICRPEYIFFIAYVDSNPPPSWKIRQFMYRPLLVIEISQISGICRVNTFVLLDRRAFNQCKQH